MLNNIPHLTYQVQLDQFRNKTDNLEVFSVFNFNSDLNQIIFKIDNNEFLMLSDLKFKPDSINYVEIKNEDIIDLMMRIVGGFEFFMIFFTLFIEPYNEQILNSKLASFLLNKKITYNFYDYIRFKNTLNH